MTTATLKQSIQLGIREMLKKFTDCSADHILCGYNNKVSLPKDNDFIIFTILTPVRYGTPRVDYSHNQSLKGSFTSTQTFRVTVQIDFYGQFAFDRANDIINISRTEVLCKMLNQYGIQPIATDNAKNLTGVSGEKEYVERWSVDLELDYCDAVSGSQDWFNTAELNIFETEL